MIDASCGPEGRRWFSESPGSPRPAAPLGGGGAVSTSAGGRFRGARFLNRAVGPSHAGDRSPGACCVRRVAAQPYGGWLARGETRQWAKRVITWQHARTTQMRMREGRSRVPHVTSRQDSTYNVRPMSTVHRSPTINPHYPLMFLPLRPGPVIKYRDFRRP